MRLAETERQSSFRLEVRGWLADVLPSLPPAPPPDDWPAKRAFDTGWQRILHEAGYAGIAWPAEFGGRGATPAEELIFLEETEAAGAPYVGCNFVGTLHAGPTIAAEGTDAQKAHHLPGILRGDHVLVEAMQVGLGQAAVDPAWRTPKSASSSVAPSGRSRR